MWEDEKNKVKNLFNCGQYVVCLKMCFRLLKIFENDKNFDHKYYCNYLIAITYYQLENYALAIKYAKIAKTFVENIASRMRINWLISCYYEKFNINEAVNYIDLAIQDCLSIQSEENLYGALVHKAFLTNDSQMAIDSINELKRININKERLDAAYQDLLMIYIHTNKFLKAQKTLNNIQDKNLKKLLLNKIYDQPKVVNGF